MIKLENSLVISQVNQYPGFRFNFHVWTKQKRNTLQEFKLPCYHLASDLLKLTCALGVYIEEFEPDQILITIDGS